MIKDFLYGHFHIREHKSTLKTEFLAGVTNYFTIIYIILLVPEIIMNAFPGAINSEGELIGGFILENGLSANEMLIALTAAAFLAAGIGSIIFGLVINVPLVQGPSLAIASFVAYTICVGFGYSYYQALAIIFLSGICFFILSILGLEEKIHNAIPKNIKFAVTAGIGLYIAFAGLKKAHILVYGGINEMGFFDITDIGNKHTLEAILAILGVLFITVLLKKHVHGAVFIGKIVCILAAIPMGLIKSVNYEGFGYRLNLSKVMLKMDFKGLVDLSSRAAVIKTVLTVAVLVFSLCIIDIFETMSMLIAADNFVKESKDGYVKKRIPQILEVDAVTTGIGAASGATSVSTYIESTAGIIEGGRTGLAAVITGILFTASVFLTPLVAVVPSAATATTLIMAGVLMMNVMKNIDFEDYAQAVPAFFTMLFMPLANSLLVGISMGVISYIVIQIFIGNGFKLNKILYILGVLFFAVLLLLPK